MSPATRPSPATPPGSAPPFWAPRTRRMVIILLALIALHLLLLTSPSTFWGRLGLSTHWRHATWLLYAPALSLWIREMSRGDRTTRRRIAAGELPCWTCGYDLSRVEPAGPCPECGQSWNDIELRARWRGMLGPSAFPAPSAAQQSTT